MHKAIISHDIMLYRSELNIICNERLLVIEVIILILAIQKSLTNSINLLFENNLYELNLGINRFLVYIEYP
jgi:hypothetical protein